jgi:hypothetical protein
MARKSRASGVPPGPGFAKGGGTDLRIGGAILAFAAHDETAANLGRQRGIFAAEGAGQAPPSALDRAPPDDLQHVHGLNIQECLYKSTSEAVRG